MTDFLRINGIPLPVATESTSHKPEVVGEMGRASDGSQWLERRYVKKTYDFECVLQDATAALATRDMLLGLGHVWNFDAHLYSSKGLGASNVFGGATQQTSVKKWGAGALALTRGATGKIYFANALPYSGSPYTISYWRKFDSGPWAHVVFYSPLLVWYVDGVRSGSDPDNIINVTGTEVQLLSAATTSTPTTIYVDDLWVCPYAWPDVTAWPDGVRLFGQAVGGPSRFKADGLFVENNLRTITCHADNVEAPKVMQASYGGAWTKNLHTLKATLVEV